MRLFVQLYYVKDNSRYVMYELSADLVRHVETCCRTFPFFSGQQFSRVGSFSKGPAVEICRIGMGSRMIPSLELKDWPFGVTDLPSVSDPSSMKALMERREPGLGDFDVSHMWKEITLMHDVGMDVYDVHAS